MGLKFLYQEFFFFEALDFLFGVVFCSSVGICTIPQYSANYFTTFMNTTVPPKMYSHVPYSL